jgi:Rrf2 family protein
MPERFLLQILRNLVAHGILESTRGVDGGYMLERAPDQISLLEVIEAIDGPLVSATPVSDGLAAESREKLDGALAAVTDVARRELAAVKLANLLPPSGPVAPMVAPTANPAELSGGDGEAVG